MHGRRYRNNFVAAFLIRGGPLDILGGGSIFFISVWTTSYFYLGKKGKKKK